MIKLYVNKNHLTVRERELLTSGSVNAYQVLFEFSPDWDGLETDSGFPVRQEVGERSVGRGWRVQDSVGGPVLPWAADIRRGLRHPGRGSGPAYRLGGSGRRAGGRAPRGAVQSAHAGAVGAGVGEKGGRAGLHGGGRAWALRRGDAAVLRAGVRRRRRRSARPSWTGRPTGAERGQRR